MLNSNRLELIENTINFVKSTLANAESGHDWLHIERVYKNALKIAEHEPCNVLVVKLAALLHDISDAKFNGGDEAKGVIMASYFLEENCLEREIIQQVLHIIQHVSFRKNIERQANMTPELAIVMDADRLDAMGAIGIARTFNYGGNKNRALYDPKANPCKNVTYKSYTQAQSATVNHFYEKLLKLKDLMNTSTGRKMAEERHHFMEQFLEQFYKEIYI